jgi:phosphatidylcholine synthase
LRALPARRKADPAMLRHFSSRILCAWSVHLYTALGAPVGFYAIVTIEQGRFKTTFWLMAVALFIDATDGTLARAARVKEFIPWFDGAKMDDIIDYLNYVLVPCYFLFAAGLLPPTSAHWIVVLPLLASAYGFSQTQAKTTDNFFLGFPSYWNVVVFYFYVLDTPTWFNGLATAVLAILVFVPIKYLYPSRSPVLRGLSVLLGIIWAAVCLLIVYLLPTAPAALAWASLMYPAFYFALSFWLHFHGDQGTG